MLRVHEKLRVRDTDMEEAVDERLSDPDPEPRVCEAVDVAVWEEKVLVPPETVEVQDLEGV